MPFTQLFLDDPVEFAKKNALVPALGTEVIENLKPKVVSPNLTIYQVKGKNRILFSKISKNAEQNRYDVQFSAAALTKEWFPIYWLPWNEDQTYRITLKASDKTFVRDANNRLADPNVFITAALTGCMVHVDGDPWQPTVYHSNAKNLKHEPPPSPEEALPWSMVQKANAMNERVRQAQTAHPKGQSHYARQWADAFTYMPLSASEKRTEKLRLRAMKVLQADMVVPVQLGTVFGIRSRDTALWSFYYQSLLRIIYFKGDTKFTVWLVRECKRFWPGSDIQKPIRIQVID